jgi:hypothetical protein
VCAGLSGTYAGVCDYAGNLSPYAFQVSAVSGQCVATFNAGTSYAYSYPLAVSGGQATSNLEPSAGFCPSATMLLVVQGGGHFQFAYSDPCGEAYTCQ